MHASLRSLDWREHWFTVIAGLIIAGDLCAVAWQGWSEAPRAMEAALLFDFALVIPLMAAYRYRAKPGAAALRALGLASLALLGLHYVVPARHQVILASLDWLRPGAMMIAFLFELLVIVAFYKAVFANKESPEALARKLGEDAALPQWVQRIVAFEVRVWRAVGDLVRRLAGR